MHGFLKGHSHIKKPYLSDVLFWELRSSVICLSSLTFAFLMEILCSSRYSMYVRVTGCLFCTFECLCLYSPRDFEQVILPLSSCLSLLFSVRKLQVEAVAELGIDTTSLQLSPGYHQLSFSLVYVLSFWTPQGCIPCCAFSRRIMS